MKVDNDQQQEIVLGNKQLLSLFFIVVVLLGVAFTIGYMIGKNTATVSAATNLNSGSTVAASRQPAQVSPNEPGPDASKAAEEPTRTDLPKEAEPAPTRTAASPRKATEKGTHSAKPYETVKAAASEPVPDSHPLDGAGASYLQVAAVKREDGEHLVELLRKRSFPALLGESPKAGLFRVLVGPFKNMQDLSESKQKLRAAGFDPLVAR